MSKDEMKKIRNLRNKLHKSIQKNGLNSETTRKISDEMDTLINEYYNNVEKTEYPKDSEMIEYYNKSYNALKDITKELKKFPTVKEWSQYAKENNYLCHLSLEYISKLDWNYLQIKVEREINFKKI